MPGRRRIRPRTGCRSRLVSGCGVEPAQDGGGVVEAEAFAFLQAGEAVVADADLGGGVAKGQTALAAALAAEQRKAGEEVCEFAVGGGGAVAHPAHPAQSVPSSV